MAEEYEKVFRQFSLVDGASGEIKKLYRSMRWLGREEPLLLQAEWPELDPQKPHQVTGGGVHL